MMAYIGLLTALGWSLLNSIWQMAVLWIIYYLVTAGNKHFSAAGKHNLALLFVVFSIEWFAYTFIQLFREPGVPVISGFIPVSSNAGQYIPYLSALYLLVLLVRLVQYGFSHPERLSEKSLERISPVFEAFTERFIRILGITKQVSVFQSENSETAQTSGFLKPLILLPVSLVTQLSAAQVEAILVHELYHIRRNDYFIHICMTCFRSIFFFNPFAHLFFKALERERELACDDGVLELGYEPRVYAEALYSLEKYRQADTGFTLAADGNKPWLLMERIRRVLGEPAKKEKRYSPLILSGLTAAFVFFGLQLISIPGERREHTGIQEVVFPVHFEMAEEKHWTPIEEIGFREIEPVKPAVQTKLHQYLVKKIQKRLPAIAISTAVPPVEPDETTEAYYVDDNVIRNYSNESAAGLVVEPVPAYQGTPFVPSASLSYESQSVSAARDSVLEKLNETCVADVVTTTRLNTVIQLKKLQKEMEKNNRLLIETEMKNKSLILMDQKNTLPVLKKLHQEIKFKKKELDGMRKKLMASTEEIIHI